MNQSRNWNRPICILCASSVQEHLLLGDSKLTKGQFGFEIHPSICSCGLIFLTPRQSEKWYEDFYRNNYYDFYQKNFNKEKLHLNANEIIDRTKKYVNKADINILDVGCGIGITLIDSGEFYNTKNIYGIEADTENIESEDITIISDDVNSDWVEDYDGYFDLIVMRHVLEHMFNPIRTLKKIKKSLKKNGLMYVAVPDAFNISTDLRDYSEWWEYYFRVVHTYYFSYETLSQVVHEAGLSQISSGFPRPNEMWVLLESNNCDGDRELDPELYEKQINYLNKILK